MMLEVDEFRCMIKIILVAEYGSTSKIVKHHQMLSHVVGGRVVDFEVSMFVALVKQSVLPRMLATS